MIDPPKSTIDFSASIPVGAAPLESILCTEELLNRRSRPPDHEMDTKPNAPSRDNAHRPGYLKQVTARDHNCECAAARINDRGPFVRGRYIDLTPAAARALG
jgi:hypothetical protein